MLGEPLKSILFSGSVLLGMALLFWRARRLANQIDVKRGEKRPVFLFVHYLEGVNHTRIDSYITYAYIFFWFAAIFTFFVG
jgi:hypothetical protein